MRALSLFIAISSTVSLGISPSWAEEESALPPVKTVEAIRTDSLAPELELTGTVVSKRRSGLSTRAEGLVERVLVDAGSEVQKGELLLQLDTRLAEIELNLIKAEIEAARVQFEDAEREWEEVRRLTETGAFSRTEAASREAMVRIRKAELEALNAKEEQQEERIARHGLVAPFSGYIVRKGTEAGEWVDTGAKVFELVETDALWFDIQVAQEYLATVQEAETARVILDANLESPLDAQVDVVVPVKDPVSRTFLTRLVFDDPEKLASPGMSGTAVLRVKPNDNASVTIPRDAIMRYPDGSAKVWIVEKSDGASTVRPVAVQTAGTLGETVEVTEGLEGGEEVVIRGNEGLEEGQEVESRRATRSDREGL